MSTTRPPMHDDRFTGPSEASRRGAHRARTKPLAAGLPVLAGVAVILLVVGGIWLVVGNGQSVEPDSTVAAAPTTSATAPVATTAPSASPSTPADQGSDEPTDEPTDEPSDRPGTTTAPENDGSGVDKGVSLVVLNSVAVKGLAARAESTLQGKGWSVERTGNSINKGLSVTKIYYGLSSMESTAEALQNDLGYGTVVRDSGVAKSGLVVVLGHDAE